MDGKMKLFEKVEQKMKLQGGTLSAIQVAIKSVRKFGTIQLTGVYGALYNMFPLGALFERNITLKMGQAPAIHYSQMLYDMVAQGKIDPTEIITHKVPLSEASQAYKTFHDHEDQSIKFILKPEDCQLHSIKKTNEWVPELQFQLISMLTNCDAVLPSFIRFLTIMYKILSFIVWNISINQLV